MEFNITSITTNRFDNPLVGNKTNRVYLLSIFAINSYQMLIIGKENILFVFTPIAAMLWRSFTIRPIGVHMKIAF